MKKTSKAMRVACALAIATAMSTCVVAGTLAKYTTSGSSSDVARVAKFGVTVTPDSGNAFASSYNGEGLNSGSVTVESTEKVIAPGTSGTLPGTTVSGTPEVSVAVNNSATVETTGTWGTDYLPIKVKVGNGPDYVTGKNAQELKENIDKKLSSQTYQPGVAVGNGAPTLSWEWAFEGNEDVKDTAAGNQSTAPTIKIGVTTTVTQID